MKIRAGFGLWVIVCLLCVVCSEEPAGSKNTSQSKLSGRWIGSTSSNSLDLQIAEDAGRITGSLQWVKITPSGEFDYQLNVMGNFDDPSVQMEFSGSNLSMSYSGMLSSDSKTIDGIFVDDFDIEDQIILSKQ